MNKINLALIGCGYWGNNIASTLSHFKNVNLKVYDKDILKSKSLKKKFNNSTVAKNLKELLSDDKISGFIIASNPSSHLKLSLKIIKQNKNILIEKPVTTKSKDLLKVKKLLNKKKSVFMSGYIYQYNPYINYIKDILKKKTLGQIKYIQCIRNNLGPIREDISSLYDLTAHDLSICKYFFNSQPKILSVSKYRILKKKNYDSITTSLKYKNILANISSSWLYPEKVRQIVIIGTKKMLQFNEMDIKNPIKIYDKFVDYPEVKTISGKKFIPTAKINVGKTFLPKIIYEQPLKNELKHFIYCILKNKKPKTNMDFSLKILQALENIDNH